MKINVIVILILFLFFFFVQKHLDFDFFAEVCWDLDWFFFLFGFCPLTLFLCDNRITWRTDKKLRMFNFTLFPVFSYVSPCFALSVSLASICWFNIAFLDLQVLQFSLPLRSIWLLISVTTVFSCNWTPADNVLVELQFGLAWLINGLIV